MPNPPASEHPRAAAVLLASCVAMLAVGINGTAIMAALPTMRTQLSLGGAGVQWTISAYLVVSGACIAMGGAAADRFGARRTAMAGLALFAIASSIIAFAGNEQTLIAARALQGIAAAFAVPSTLADIRTSAAAEGQGSAVGAWSGFLMLGFSIGPLIGGALTHLASWRAIFWLNVALMAFAVAGLALGGPTTRRSAAEPAKPVDWAGFALLAAFMVSLVVALQALPHAPLASAAVIGPLAVALVAFICLLTVELRCAAPLFDVRFFRHRAFALGAATGSLAMLCIMSLLLYYNLYAQSATGLRLTPLAAGASLLPLSLALLAVAVSAAKATARFGVRAAATLGMMLIAIGSVALSFATGRGDVAFVAAAFLIIGAGLALPYAIAPQLALSALPPEQAGQGSGMVNACTFLGGSIGVALGAIAFAAHGFTGVLVMLALAGLLGTLLARFIPRAG